MEYVGVFSVLFLMLGALVLAAALLRRFGLVPGSHRQKPGDKEIEVVASRLLDARNRLVVVRWRGQEYLLGAGTNGVTRIDSDTTDDTDAPTELDLPDTKFGQWAQQGRKP